MSLCMLKENSPLSLKNNLLKELPILLELMEVKPCSTKLNTNKLDLMEKLSKLILTVNPLEKETMDIGSLYKTGLLVLLLVEEVPKLCTENVCPLLTEEMTVKEKLF